jgi:flagellar biosynthesis protein FlhB
MSKGDAGDKTEKPTPKKRREARKQGQIARSVDLVQWVALLVATYVLPATTGALLQRLGDDTRSMFEVAASGEPGPAYGELGDVLGVMAIGLAPLFGIMFVVTLVGLIAQGGVVVVSDAVKPKFSRISPKAGFKRLVSTQSLMETAKAVLRLVVFGVVVYTVVQGTVRELVRGTPSDLRVAVPVLAEQLLSTLRMAAVAGVLIGAADYLFQRHQVEKRMKMSKQEIRQEMKSSEGDPMIKGRRRSAHARLTRNGMLAAVDDASVVVVNPTHVAVALRYANGEGAPRVVAKGGDETARRIRERAMESGVPVLEVRPLARLLFDTVRVGEAIPVDLFEAVAVVLAFVLRNPRKAWSGTVRRLDVPVPVRADAA